MRLRLAEFAGMAPKIDPRRLAEKLATKSHNAGFGSGALGPLPVEAEPSLEFSSMPSGTRAILRPGSDGTRLAFTTDAKGAAFASLVVPNDEWGRAYYGTPYGPRYTTNENYTPGELTVNPVSYKLGVKTPEFAPMPGLVTAEIPEDAEGGGALTVAKADIVRVMYVFTFVDAYGHEGAPSVPSSMVEVPYGTDFTVDIAFSGETMPETNVSGALRRIYRATYDGTLSQFQYIAEIPLALTSWVDNTPLGSEQEYLVSANWVPPPRGVTEITMASNFAVGYFDNMLVYSEVNLPHAWPEQYRFRVKYPIVKVAPTTNGIFIATKGSPYWAFGADPASAVPVELDANHPCLSADSVVDMGGTVIYATYDGLVSVSGQEAVLVSDSFIDRLTWLRDFDPENMKAFEYEDQYVFSVGDTWWMFDPADGGQGFSTLDSIEVEPSGLRQIYYDAMRDTSVLLAPNGEAYDIISAEGREYEWKSKVFETPPTCFALARVLADEYPVELTIESEGGTFTYEANSPAHFRLHAGFRSRTWIVGIRAQSRVSEVSLAHSQEEL